MEKKISVFFCLSIFFTLSVCAQTSDDIVNDMIDRVNRYYSERPHDNVFLHTDRSVYFSGEDVLFRAYVADAATLRSSNRSDKLLLSLMSDKGEDVLTVSYNIDSDKIQGTFKVPDQLDFGKYTLNAIVTAGEIISSYKTFSRDIIILDKSQQIMVDYSFLKEGYNEGDEFDLTVSAYGYRSRPIQRVQVDYKIILGDEVINTGTEKTGKDGKLNISSVVPEVNNNRLIIDITTAKRRDNQHFKIMVPVINSEQEVITSDMNPVKMELKRVSDRKINLACSYSDTELDPDMKILVLIFRKGVLYWSAPGKLSQAKSLDMPVANIPSGILQVCILDAEGKLLGNKYIYSEHENRPDIQLSTDKDIYNSRSLVKSDIQLMNMSGIRNNEIFLSMSVVPADFVPKDQLFIDDQFLLEVDLKQNLKNQVAGLKKESQPLEAINALINVSEKNGYSMKYLLGEKGLESENLSMRKQDILIDYEFLPPFFEAEKMIDFSLGMKDKRFHDADKANYQKLLQSGMPVLEVIKTIKPYTLDGNKIIFPGKINSIYNQQGAYIVVDNQRLGEDASLLNSISPAEVESIFISTNPEDIQRYTGLNTVGIIEITTKGNKDSSKFSNETPRDKMISEAGGQGYIEGYPDYSKEKDQKMITTDHRRTVFWEPLLQVSPDGKVSVEFYTPDLPGNYLIIVQGMAGIQPVSAKKYFQVR